MDHQLPVASEDYPSFATYEPLLFLGDGAVTDLDRVILSFHPMSCYDYFAG